MLVYSIFLSFLSFLLFVYCSVLSLSYPKQSYRPVPLTVVTSPSSQLRSAGYGKALIIIVFYCHLRLFCLFCLFVYKRHRRWEALQLSVFTFCVRSATSPSGCYRTESRTLGVCVLVFVGLRPYAAIALHYTVKVNLSAQQLRVPHHLS